jgi:cell pole-organizing protein PopZ
LSGQATPPGGAPPGVASDQSMEDILASIRRILNEDETPAAPGTATEAAAAPAAMPPAEDGPLLLTEEMIVAAPVEPAPPVQPVAPPVAPPPAPALAADSLLAPAVAAAASASVGQLLRAVSSERGAAVTRGGPTIEDVVREELRPLLKDWLDQHLPGIVERLVRAEIERVTGRALS